jgi:hypothetical protein
MANQIGLEKLFWSGPKQNYSLTGNLTSKFYRTGDAVLLPALLFPESIELAVTKAALRQSLLA